MFVFYARSRREFVPRPPEQASGAEQGLKDSVHFSTQAQSKNMVKESEHHRGKPIGTAVLMHWKTRPAK
jgi:hypothetical protein